MESRRTTRGWSAWRSGFFPALALLGIALPITFLTWIERYLYYIRPLELIPAFATAWLLTASLVIPFSLVCALLLRALSALEALRRLRSALTAAVLTVTAATVVAALSYAVLLWCKTFGVLSDFPVEKGLVIFSLAVVGVAAFTRRGDEALSRIYSIAKYATALGALSLISLPFFGWGSASNPVTPAAPPPVADTHPRPHILLVTIDALSASHMSLYGAARPTTPSLDAFARGAMNFDHAYANANFTTAGVSSILTATRPWIHRALHLQSWPTAAARGNSIPAVLDSAGYLTAYFSTNTFASPTRGGMGQYFRDGSGDLTPRFSLCSDRLSARLPYDCAAAALPPLSFAVRLLDKLQDTLDGHTNWHFDPRTASTPALQWLAAADKRTPIFLWVHFLPPHAPYAAPAPWLGRFDSSQLARDATQSDSKDAYLFAAVPPEQAHALAARYDESVEYVDHYVGEFLARASQLLGDNTVVIVTADHGESFEHGYGAHTGPGLYEPIIHIPLLVKLPFQKQALHSSDIAEQIDIGPTLAELAGIAPPTMWEGRSLLPRWNLAPDAPPRAGRPAFSMNFEENRTRAPLTTGSVAVIDGGWKLVHYSGPLSYPLMPQLHDELYDLAADPHELTNRIADQPDQAQRLRNLITAELASHGAAVQ